MRERKGKRRECQSTLTEEEAGGWINNRDIEVMSRDWLV